MGIENAISAENRESLAAVYSRFPSHLCLVRRLKYAASKCLKSRLLVAFFAVFKAFLRENGCFVVAM
jgi:hypothetical protein